MKQIVIPTNKGMKIVLAPDIIRVQASSSYSWPRVKTLGYKIDRAYGTTTVDQTLSSSLIVPESLSRSSGRRPVL